MGNKKLFPLYCFIVN